MGRDSSKWTIFFFERINRISNLTVLKNLLHNFNPEELVFKTVRGIFEILLTLVALQLICQS